MITRFGDLETVDIHYPFNKLKQVGTVANYEARFEEFRVFVLSKNKGLMRSISCRVSLLG